MSENKQEKASDKILKEIANLKAEIQTLKTSTNSDEPTTEVHHLFDPNCPTCKPKIDAYVKEHVDKGRDELLKLYKERANLDHECAECGLGVKKEDEDCPACHGKKARKR